MLKFRSFLYLIAERSVIIVNGSAMSEAEAAGSVNETRTELNQTSQYARNVSHLFKLGRRHTTFYCRSREQCSLVMWPEIGDFWLLARLRLAMTEDAVGVFRTTRVTSLRTTDAGGKITPTAGPPTGLVLLEELGDRVDQESSQDVRSDFASDVNLRVAEGWEERDFELVVRRSNEWSGRLKVLVGSAN